MTSQTTPSKNSFLAKKAQEVFVVTPERFQTRIDRLFAFCFAVWSVADCVVTIAFKSAFVVGLLPFLLIAIDPFIASVNFGISSAWFTFGWYLSYLQSDVFHHAVLLLFFTQIFLKWIISGKLSAHQVNWRNLLRKEGYYPPAAAPGAQAEISSAKQS